MVARPAPAAGVRTNSEAFVATAGKLKFPEYDELQKTTNTDGLESFLTEFAGITANRHVPKAGQTRAPVVANISHATFLLFQPQNRIADQTTLFYRQEEPFLGQAIKDTLPYFIGAASDDRFEQLQKLRRLKRDVKLLQQRIEIEDSIAGDDNSKALTLLAEAEQYGIIPNVPNSEDSEELLDFLRSTLTWTPSSPTFDQNDKVNALRNDRDNLITQLERLRNEIDAARSFALDQRGFSNEVKEQRNRLESIGLYKSPNKGVVNCPLCDSELPHAPPSTEQLISSLHKIDEQIDAVVRQRPRLEKYISERSDEIDRTTRLLEENKLALDAIYNQEEQMREQRLMVSRQARIVGRISLFLDSIQSRVAASDIRDRLAKKEKELKRLEKKASDESVDERLAAALRIIGNQMTTWAKLLELEHSENSVDLDLKNLTVVAYTRTGTVPMREMGSGENWVCCHLIAYLALHQWFVSQNRPVPHFLMLDQPTQVYFPTDNQTLDRSIDDLEDEDRVAVRKMFKLIFEVAASLAPDLQIIITDHADLNEPWFQKAVVERWRGPNKLIPEDWYS